MTEEPIETGFGDVIAGNIYVHDEAPLPLAPEPIVTATVTDDEKFDARLTQAGKDAAKALVSLPKLDYPTLARLAREVAMDIKRRDDILQEFGLNNAQYEYLEANNEFYLHALKACCVEWQAPLTTQERIKVEAAAILEDSLLGLGARMQNKGEGLPGVIEAAKLFAKVAGVGERADGAAAPGERFTISIDLGGDQKVTVEAQTKAALTSSSDLLS